MPAAVLLVMMVATYVSWHRLYPSATWRYRLSVSIESSGQIYTGSGVYQVSEWRVSQFLPEVRTRETRIRGEAIFIDLETSNLVVTLTSARKYRQSSVGLSELSQKAFLSANLATDFTEIPELRNIKTEVEPNWLPVLVAFENVQDPQSYHIVPPSGSSYFNGRVIFVEVELTGYEITTGIRDHLPFLNTMDRDKPLSGDILPSPTDWLSSSDFYSDMEKGLQ